MNNSNDILDAMLKNYYGREEESFCYKEPTKRHSYLRYPSFIAAALVIVICAGLLLYSALEPQNKFVINVAAQGTEEYTNLSVKTFYKTTFDLNCAGVTDRSEMLTAGIISVSGDTVTDIEAKSLNGKGEFLKATDEGFYCLDSKGNPKVCQDDSRIILICSDGEFTENEKSSSIWYVPVDSDGSPISNNEYIDEKKADTVQMKIHFEDGTYIISNVLVTYSDGKMNIKAE